MSPKKAAKTAAADGASPVAGAAGNGVLADAEIHPTLMWAQSEVWPVTRKLYKTLEKDATGVGGVSPFDSTAFKAAMASDGQYTCTVTVNAFKENKFSFGALPTQDAVEATEKLLLAEPTPGWQLASIPVRVSNIVEDPPFAELDILALDETRLAIDLKVAKVMNAAGGKVNDSTVVAMKQLLSRIEATFYYVQDGDAYEREKWLSRIRLRQAVEYIDIRGASRTRQVHATKERLSQRPEGCNQKQVVEWFRVIQAQQAKEGFGKDPDLDLTKHAIEAHLALEPRLRCAFALLVEFDVNGNRHCLSTLKGLQRLAAVTSTDAGGSDLFDGLLGEASLDVFRPRYFAADRPR